MSLIHHNPEPLPLPDSATLQRAGAELYLGTEAATAHEGYLLQLVRLRNHVDDLKQAADDDIQQHLTQIHAAAVGACKAWHHYRSALYTLRQHNLDPEHALHRAGRARHIATG